MIQNSSIIEILRLHEILQIFFSFQFGGNYTKYIACDYGPSGNFRGERMYITGKPCGACPANTKCNQSTKLCQ